MGTSKRWHSESACCCQAARLDSRTGVCLLLLRIFWHMLSAALTANLHHHSTVDEPCARKSFQALLIGVTSPAVASYTDRLTVCLEDHRGCLRKRSESASMHSNNGTAL